MASQQPPKIEFPCPDYPIKALGLASDEYHQAVLAIFDRHAFGFDREKVRVQKSRNGRFHSITVFIEATGEDQLKDIFDDLKRHPSTKMVL